MDFCWYCVYCVDLVDGVFDFVVGVFYVWM